MATFYEDRGVMLLNGRPIVDLFTIKSLTFTIDYGVDAVQSMTPDHSAAGFTQRNVDIEITLTVALPGEGLKGFVPEEYDWYSNNAVVQVYGSSSLYASTFKGDKIQFLGVAFSGYGSSGFSGVGREGEYVWNFKAQDAKRIPG